MTPTASLSLLTLVFLLASRSALAQTTSATCSSSYDWAKNSRSQSPCLVAAYLQGACTSETFNVPSLPAGSYYTGPAAGRSNPCYCSTVVYSLTSACGDCQDHPFVSWSSWATNCTTMYLSEFPLNIPEGTSVPSWAYLDVATSDTYSPILARQDAITNVPESTRTSPITSSTSRSSPSDSSSSKVGAIAGGVVGGVVVLGLLAGIIVWFYMRRRRARMAPSAQFLASTSMKEYDPSAYDTVTTPTEKVHEPDQNTLPSPSTTPLSNAQPISYTPKLLSYTPNLHSGQYTGAPEI